MGDAWKEHRQDSNRRQHYRGIQRHPNSAKDDGNRIGRINSAAPMKNGSQLMFQLPSKPKIQLGEDQVINPDEDVHFSMRKSRYLQPVTIIRLALLTTENDFDVAKEFLTLFVKNGESRGMCFPPINSINVEIISDPSSFAQWEAAFEIFNNRAIKFVLMVGTIRNPNTHKFLKLCESQSKIVTQLVTSEVAKRIISKGQYVTLISMEIVKTDVKL